MGSRRINNLFKFCNEEQTVDLIYAISRHFEVRITQTPFLNEYAISTKLYPTNRIIEVTMNGFENALWEFTQELKKYMSDELIKEIDLILDTEKYLEVKANEKIINTILKVLEVTNE